MKRGSTRRLGRRSFLKGALATAPFLIAGPSLLNPGRARAHGFSPVTTTDEYLLPSIPGVRTVAILTVGDRIGSYRMVGIPDGRAEVGYTYISRGEAPDGLAPADPCLNRVAPRLTCR